MAKWLEKEVVSPIDGIPPIEEWQSARCSACGKYHTTPYMYYFDEYKFCPNCGQAMNGKDEPQLKGSKRLLKGKTEPQTEETEIERLERIDNEIEDVWARIRELTDEPQTERQRLEGKRWTDALTIEEKKRLLEGFWIKDEPQSELCRDCKDYAGNGMFCAKNYMVYDFSRSVCKTESQERSE